MPTDYIKRVGILGDIHAEDEHLSLALQTLSSLGIDRLFSVGDIVDGPGSVERCCQLLQQFDVETVAGNHERWFFSQASQQLRQGLPDYTPEQELSQGAQSFLRTLPKTRAYQTSLGRALLCHGLLEEDMASVGPDDYGYALACNDPLQALLQGWEYTLVLNGHTHRPMVRRIERLTIINAGTLFREHSPGFVLADFEERRVQFYQIDASLRATLHKEEKL